jgi:hypothetical protein
LLAGDRPGTGFAGDLRYARIPFHNPTCTYHIGHFYNWRKGFWPFVQAIICRPELSQATIQFMKNLSGGLGVPSSNLGAPTNTIKHLAHVGRFERNARGQAGDRSFGPYAKIANTSVIRAGVEQYAISVYWLTNAMRPDRKMNSHSWQPIETAPKDGRQVLLGRAGWGAVLAEWRDDAWIEHLGGESYGTRISYEPTHWIAVVPVDR